MSDPTVMFLSGLVLGAMISFSVLLLFGQYLFASGILLTAPRLTDDEERIASEQRLLDALDESVTI